VSGVLLHQNGVFIQVLEGEDKVVSALFDRIARDSRPDPGPPVRGLEHNAVRLSARTPGRHVRTIENPDPGVLPVLAFPLIRTELDFC